MTFWEHFGRLLLLRPSKALVALFWHLTGKKVRGRNQLNVASADLPFAYALWRRANEQDHAIDAHFSEQAACWTEKPTFSIILVGSKDSGNEALQETLQSIAAQLYPALEDVDGLKDLRTAVCEARGHYLIPVQLGDRLAENALFRFAEALQQNPGAQILFGDHDHLDAKGGRRRPWFKPQWNRELFLAQDYLSAALTIERGLASSIVKKEPVENVGELVFLATEKANSIVHVPHILSHIKEGPRANDRLSFLGRHLKRHGASVTYGPFETTRVSWPIRGKLPLVSIIIPTRDKVELLKTAVQTVLDKTDYSNFEILIIDNGSVDKRTKTFFDDIRLLENVRVLCYDKAFNYSELNNFGVRHARGSYLCFLNNDTEVLNESWLTELMRYAIRPEVGAAGAMLLYDDGSIQHAGVIVGIGDAAGHAHRYLPSGDPGYHRMAYVAQYVSAVTGACLVVEKAKFDAVRGFDAERFAIAFNDVDLCMKLQDAGWRNMYVPHAVLVHHESKSRGSDTSPQQIGRFMKELETLQERWGTKTYSDPLHNPNLDRYSERLTFRL